MQSVKCIKNNCENDAAGTYASVRGAVPICRSCCVNSYKVEPTPFVEVASGKSKTDSGSPGSGPRLTRPRTKKPPRDLAPEELEHRETIRAHRLAQTRALESLSPAMPIEGERVKKEHIVDITKAKEIAALLKVPRLSGTGMPGSALVLSVREYDGQAGGVATRYVLLFIEMRSQFGKKYRSIGIRVLESELPEVIAALTKAGEMMKETGT